MFFENKIWGWRVGSAVGGLELLLRTWVWFWCYMFPGYAFPMAVIVFPSWKKYIEVFMIVGMYFHMIFKININFLV